MYYQSSLGVPQGGVMSPILFTLTLDWILLKDDRVKNLMERGDVCAYADDLVISCSNGEEDDIVRLIDHLRDHNLG